MSAIKSGHDNNVDSAKVRDLPSYTHCAGS